MIRIAVVDDHHAVRLGLEAMLTAEPDMEPVGAAATAAETWPLLYRTAPDVVLVDYRLPDLDGLTVCQRIKAAPPAPAVVLHSAFADDGLTVAALVAGADGVVHKGAPGRDLAEAIRTVAAGARSLPALDPELVRAGAEVLDGEDLPILGMLLHGTSRDEIARILHLDAPALQARLADMLGALRARPIEPALESA
ncbi:MAG TPA: response regulator transcription factor [Solirubrobacteraceae bacterium]|nr:response regulator transcription factor [Solirubrobacteraceae bacterium]